MTNDPARTDFEGVALARAGDSDGTPDFSAEELKALLDASPDCIKLVELDGSISYMNLNGQCAMDIDDFSTLRGREWSSFWPGHARTLVRQAVSTATRGESNRFEALCPTAKGKRKWWDVSVSPIFDERGQVIRLLSTSRDITEIVERERRLRVHDTQLMDYAEAQADALAAKEELLRLQDTLLREIDHRVKNSLAMISSLLRMQASASHSEEVEDELHDAANRVLTVSRVHEKLYQGRDVSSVNMREYIEPLCTEIRNAVSSDAIAINLDLPDELISADMAVAMGLIVSELLSNALRHGFEDSATGLIDITCKGDREAFVFTVADNGRGVPENFSLETAMGLGMKIVRLYASQLGGQLTYSSKRGHGTEFTVSVNV